MAKVVYTDWRDRAEEPEIVGVYTNEYKAYRKREHKERELEEDGYNTEEEVRVWIEDIDIVGSEIRDRILREVKGSKYKEFEKHKDLISFCICNENFETQEDINNGICADFHEVIVVVEKDWLFKNMKDAGIENPLKYLQEEYNSDDSYNWYCEALINNKIVMIDFN